MCVLLRSSLIFILFLFQFSRTAVVKKNDLTLKTLKRFNFKLRGELIENSDRAAFQLRYFSLTEAVSTNTRARQISRIENTLSCDFCQTFALQPRVGRHVVSAFSIESSFSPRSAIFWSRTAVEKNKSERIVVREMHRERILHTDRPWPRLCVRNCKARSLFLSSCVNLSKKKRIVHKQFLRFSRQKRE